MHILTYILCAMKFITDSLKLKYFVRRYNFHETKMGCHKAFNASTSTCSGVSAYNLLQALEFAWVQAKILTYMLNHALSFLL